MPGGLIALEVMPELDINSSLLHEFGFRPSYTLAYLSHDLDPIEDCTGAVSKFAHDEVEVFLDLLEVEGVPFPPTRRAQKREFYCTDEFHCFGVRDTKGELVGWSTFHLKNHIAIFGNTYVLPEHRGLGHHRQLLLARLAHAKTEGAVMALTDVEPYSVSQANCERAGFKPVTTTTVWEVQSN